MDGFTATCALIRSRLVVSRSVSGLLFRSSAAPSEFPLDRLNGRGSEWRESHCVAPDTVYRRAWDTPNLQRHRNKRLAPKSSGDGTMGSGIRAWTHRTLQPPSQSPTPQSG